VGQRFGRRALVNGKTLEGTLAMFAASLITLGLSLAYFSALYPFTFSEKIIPALAAAAVVAVAEVLSPKGFDNIAVPLLGALTFIVSSGGL
jgi:dolichol kinase